MTKIDPNTMRKRRIALYSIGSALFVALIYAGFVAPQNVKADPGTLLSMAEVNLKVVQMLSEKAEDAEIVQLRKEHLAKARQHLAETERQFPGLAITRELEAYACTLARDYTGAVQWYRKTLEVADIEPTLRRKLRLNLARTLLECQQQEEAARELEQISAPDRDSEWWIVRAHVEHRRGRDEARTSALEAAFRAAKTDDSTRKIVAEAAFDLGDGIAASCYSRIAEKGPMDWYRLAQLKVQAGQFDSAGEALIRVRQSKPELLEKLLTADREFWSRYEDKGFHPMESRTNQAAGPNK